MTRFITIFIIAIFAENIIAEENILPSRRGNNHSFSFTENKGQIADISGKLRPEILYTADADGAELYFTNKGVNYVFAQSNQQSVVNSSVDVLADRFNSQPQVKLCRMDMEFVGSNPNVNIHSEEVLLEYFNYYYGHCPDGITGVKTYKRLVYENIYPAIDIVFYEGQKRGMKYDFVVHPGGNVADIKMQYHGAKKVTLNAANALKVVSPLGEIEETIPMVYQTLNSAVIQNPKHVLSEVEESKIQNISATYTLNNGIIRFSISDYDNTKSLIIDPWSTYYGGTGEEGANAIATDSSGNVFITGYTFSKDFPVTTSDTLKGSTDVIVVKFDKDGNRLWSTYYGSTVETGASNTESGNGIAIDRGGNIIVTGLAAADAGFFRTDFPVTTPPSPMYGGYFSDAFILKFNNSGIRQWARFVGGNTSEVANAVATDTNDNIFITGQTNSPNFSPPTNTTCGHSVTGNPDAFIAAFTPAGVQIWSNLYGGDYSEKGSGIATDKSGNVFVTGSTTSKNICIQNAFQAAAGSWADAFVAEFNAAGVLLWSSYCGGSADEAGTGIVVDPNGDVIVTGSTSSTDFLKTTVTATGFQPTIGGGNDAYVVKITNAGTLVWASYCGGNGNDFGTAIARDQMNNILVAGGSPSTNLLTTSDAFQLNNAGRIDAFLLKVNSTGQKKMLTYYGGTGNDAASGIATDTARGFITFCGSTGSIDFPVTRNAFQKNQKGGGDAFVVHFPFIPAIAVADTFYVGRLFCFGDSVTKTFQIHDTALVNLRIDSMKIVGADSLSFKVATPTKSSFPYSVPGYDSNIVRIRFYGSVPSGRKTAKLIIYSNDPLHLKDTVVLIGDVDSVGILTLKKSVNYGTLGCADSCRDSIVTMRNTGRDTITVTPNLEGKSPSQFGYSPLSVKIAPGATGQFAVRFCPGGDSTYDARIRFTTIPCNKSDTTHLRGIKNSNAKIASSVQTLRFDTLQCPTDTIIDAVVKIKNNGTVIDTIKTAGIVNSSDFVIISQPVLPMPVNVNDSVMYTIRLKAKYARPYNGFLAITAQPCNLGLNIPLVGFKDSVNIMTSQKSLLFDTLSCGKAADSIQVSITNTGTRKTTVTPTLNTPFTVSPSSAPNIASGGSANFRVKFTPAANDSTYNAVLRFTGSQCLATDTIHLHGVKQSMPRITVSTTSLSFGTIGCGATKDTIIVVKNTGTMPVTFQEPVVSSAPDFVLMGPSGPQMRSPNDSVVYTIRFTGNNSTGAFIVNASPCDLADSVQLSGSCIPNAVTFSFPPTISIPLGDHALVPIYVDGIGTVGITSCDIYFSFDSAALYIHGYNVNGTLSEGNSPSITRLAADKVRIHIDASGGFVNAGVLIYLDIQTLIGMKNNSAMTFDSTTTSVSDPHPVSVANGTITATGCEATSKVRPGITLSQNRPNPFSRSTVITYQLPLGSDVELSIYDMFGRKLKEVVNKYQEQGSYDVPLSLENFSPGLHIYQLRTPFEILTKKMMVAEE